MKLGKTEISSLKTILVSNGCCKLELRIARSLLRKGLIEPNHRYRLTAMGRTLAKVYGGQTP